jgi:hypothetical protein
MLTKTTTNDFVVTSQSSTTSNDHIEIKLRPQKVSRRKDKVQLSIGADDRLVISPERKRRVTQNAREFLESYPNQNQAQQAHSILSIIDNLFEDYDDSGFPEIGVFSSNDGTLGMQWDVGDTTLGIGIDPEITESYWFLLSGAQDRDVRAKGSLAKVSILIPWLVWLLEKMGREREEE